MATACQLLLPAAVTATASARAPGTLTVTFLYVGHCDSVLVQAPNRGAIAQG